MPRRRRLRAFAVLAVSSWLALALVAAGHVICEKVGQEDLRVAGARLDELRGEIHSRRGERATIAERPLPGNAASVYRELLEDAVSDPSLEACTALLAGEETGILQVIEELDAHESILERLRDAVRRERCAWNPTPTTRRVCSLGGATVPRVIIADDARTFGLYRLAPLFSAASRLAELRGEPREGAQLLLEGMQVLLDMARGTSTFNLIVASSRIERFGHLLVDLLRRTTDADWDRAERLVKALRSEEFLQAWKGDLFLEMYGQVYLPTVPRMILLEGNESGTWQVFRHFVPVFFSSHASSAKCFRQSRGLWMALESLEMSYDPEGLSRVREFLESQRGSDVYLREAADEAWAAILAAVRLESLLRLTQAALRVRRFFTTEQRWPDPAEFSALTSDLKDPHTGGEYPYEREETPLITGQGGYSRARPGSCRTLIWSFAD